MGMTTIAQLIAKLQTLPQDAEVEVLKEGNCGYSVTTGHAPLDLEYGMPVFDYREDRWKNSALYGRVILFMEAE